MSTVRAALGGVLALVLWLLLGAVPAGADTHERVELSVELTDISPTVLRPEGELTISGTITNESDDVVSSPRVDLLMLRLPFSSRAAVDAWVSGETSALIGGALPHSEELDGDIDPGQTVPFTIVLPASPTFAETSLWGPRGIEIQVRSGPSTTSVRNFLMWFPRESPLDAPAELSAVLPLTPTAQEWQQALRDDVPVASAAAARLTDVLEGARDREVAWAVDPALLEQQPVGPAASLQALLSDPTTDAEPTDDADVEPNGGNDPGGQADPDGTPGPPDPPDLGSTLRASLITGNRGRDTLMLDYASAHVSALAHARDLHLRQQGHQRGTDLLHGAGITWLDAVQWPAGDLDGVTLSALAAENATTVMLGSTALFAPASAVPASTTVDTTSGTLDVVVYDERISALLTGRAPTGELLDDVTARQWLLADTAAAIREGGAEMTSFLAAYPRDVHAADLTSHWSTLRDAPWLHLTSVRGLLGGSTVDAGAALPAALSTPGQLSTEQVNQLGQARADVMRVASTLPDPAALTEELDPPILTALSATWTQAPDDRAALMQDLTDTVALLRGALRIEPGSSVLLINHSGELPITVANDLPLPAAVTIALRPTDPRLRAPQQVEAVLEPNSITTVRVPVQAVANGNVEVEAHILGEDGDTGVGEAATFTVRVRADWEDIGTAVVAALLAVGFALGLIRTIRSGRRTEKAGARTQPRPGEPRRAREAS